MIYNQHRAPGRFTPPPADPRWSAPGIGYWYLAFPSGRIYWVGDLETQRAAVGGQNHHIVACSMVGDFTNQIPSGSMLDAVHSLRLDLEGFLERSLSVRPHRFYGGTACPGNTFGSWIGLI